ncbi:hypothetical protein [Caballeronia sordidicola]|uniref:hypothetical protein n=1 Tax=Caballeronia sordidicola TaxID=196367 RepID=UPI00117E624C|nr:hypothetical protein [Caballeronia sordidicola]
MLFFSRGIPAETLASIGNEEMNAMMRQVHIDYRSIARTGSDGNLQLTVDPKQSFKILKNKISNQYTIAITYVPKNSKIEDIESQCEIAMYSAQRRFVSTILSVGLSSYGICEGFDAIGFVRD